MAEHVNENLVGTKEAAELFGVRPANFVRDWTNRGDFPKPVATLARGRLWAREELLSYRARRRPRRAVALAELPLSRDATRWLPLIKRRIVRGFRPDRNVLFGSQARGGVRPGGGPGLPRRARMRGARPAGSWSQTRRSVDALRHPGDSRLKIPTAELGGTVPSG